MTINAIAELENLQKAGVPEKQAKAHLRLISSLMGSELATKVELKKVEAELKRDIEGVRAELKRDIKEMELSLKHDIFAKLFYFSLAIISVLGSLMGYMKFFID